MARMAPSGRKRKAAAAPNPTNTDTPIPTEPAGTTIQEEEKCPACTEGHVDQNKDTWICCDACKTWYHWVCAGNGGDSDQIDKWFCKSCLEADPTRVITLKPPPRKSGRKKANVDFSSDTPMSDGTQLSAENSLQNVTQHVANEDPSTSMQTGVNPIPPPSLEVNKWIAVAESKTYTPDTFRRMNGSDIGLEWILSDENAMKEPIVVENSEGLGMKMPPKELTVRDIANEVGPDTPVEVIDVSSQSSCPGWTLGKWADYYHSSPEERDRIRNVISLEVSGTPLGGQILPPRLVRELDWVEKFWPPNKKQLGQYPKVQLYCLMSVAQCWTDWHIDFAGSSVYYHILHGSKVFYFIKPTQANLAAYEQWSGTDIQDHTWLGDMADEVVRVELTAGNTMIIPTGWIHAVYTPSDTLVFGGNFLHSLNVKTQLRVREIEIKTRVPKKFRFPLFTKLCWYVAEKYCKDLRSKEEIAPRILKSLDALATFLVAEARIIERGPEVAKKEARENVPADRVKDPSLLARELRWRVRSAAGVDSDCELGDDGNGIISIKRENSFGVGRPGKKRKDDLAPMFKNWQPPEWSTVENVPPTVLHDTITVDQGGKEVDWIAREGLSGDVMRNIKTNGIVKLRKLENGTIERYSVVRTVEYVTPSAAEMMEETM